MTGHTVETEVKFRTTDLTALREVLLAQGAVVVQARHRERNVVFEDGARSLRPRQMVLRLRDALETVLTFKGPPDPKNTQHRARPEYEVTVSDYDAMFRILTALGYAPDWQYEKYREALQWEEVVIALDHTPIGDFVEIEGQPEAIRPAAERLGFDWGTRNLHTYREMFDAVRSAGQVNMLFEER